jgi:hypothetical protein
MLGRKVRFELPSFSGMDPREWLYKANHFFLCHNVPMESRVDVAVAHFEGSALRWYHWLSLVRGKPDWNHFVAALLERFGPTTLVNYHVALKQLKQKGSLDEYQAEYEELCAMVPHVNQETLFGSYVGGLRDDLRIEVLSANARTPEEAYKVVKWLKRKGSNLGLLKDHTGYPMSKRKANSLVPAANLANRLRVGLRLSP